MAQNLPNEIMERFLAAAEAVQVSRLAERTAASAVESAIAAHRDAQQAKEQAEADFASLVQEAAKPTHVSPVTLADLAAEEFGDVVAKEEFTVGHHTQRVVAFLNANPARFFTAAEMGPYIAVANMDSLRTTLATLATENEIVRGEKGRYGAKALAPTSKEAAPIVG